MAVPTLDIRVNFDRLGVSRLANDGFETDTAGWSVAAGIQAAATTITRTVSAPYMGVAVGRLVTTATNGSGVKFVMASTFASGTTYRFRVYLKSVSGTTAATIKIGSLGTVGDRASSALTMTTSWASYQVDFTPSGNRADIQVNVTNNAASIMTADIDDAEVFAVVDDVSAQADSFTFTHGANFEGGLAAGQCTLRLKNDTRTYTGAAANSTLAIGCPIYVRATYAGIAYGLFYGIIKRFVPDASMEMVEAFATDPVDSWSRSAEVSVAVSITRSISAFRGAILDALGEPAARRNLTLFEDEANIPVTGADQAGALSLLGELDKSTATIGYLLFDPSPSILYKYTTIARNARSSQAVDETITDVFTDIGYEVNEDVNITDQRVLFAIRAPSTTAVVVWQSSDLPISVAVGETRTIWATYSDPTLSSVLDITSINGPTVNFTPFSQSAKIEIIGPVGGTTISALAIEGQALLSGDSQSVLWSSATAGSWTVRGADINATYVISAAAANGLADWSVNHLATYEPRLDLTVRQRFPTQVARQIGDRVVVQTPRVNTTSWSDLIRTVSTSISAGGSTWATTYGLEPAGIPLVGNAFTVNTTQLNDATSKLGY